MHRPTLAAAVLLALLAAPARAQGPAPAATPAPSVAPTPSPVATPTPTPIPEPLVAPGVRAGGIALGGLTEAAALAAVRVRGRPAARGRIFVRFGALRYSLAPSRAGIRLDARRTVRRALRAATGTRVALALTWKPAVVAAFVAKVAARGYAAPRDATLHIGVRRMIRHRGREGRAVPVRALRARLDAALADPSRSRVVRLRRVPVRPRVTWAALARIYGTVITVDRRSFVLRLFKRLRLARRYGVAVGAAGYDTPTGLYRITSKQVNPAWTAPNRPWAGAYAGRTVPGGAPDNPLRARWLGIYDGVGIHGTAEPWSIGSRASHGCIRMRVPDVVDLYRRVPLGTPVLIR